MISVDPDLLRFWRWRILAAIILIHSDSLGLTTDGVILLSFKYSILSDPLQVLHSWNYTDATPCSWYGVTCAGPASAVTALSLPNSALLGSIPATLGTIPHLRLLNLSNNSINGSIPDSLFFASELQTLDFSNNLISGDLPPLLGNLKSLRLLNLSDNALAGRLPANLSDLSSNLFNGTLPVNFGGEKVEYLNVSYNRLSGDIPPEFAAGIAANATIDLSSNDLTGEIPESDLFSNQRSDSYSGNANLCGKPLKSLCPIPSSAAIVPNSSVPAIAAIPNTITSSPGPPQQGRTSGLPTGTIIGIVAGDVAGIAVLLAIFGYVYSVKKRGSAKKEAEIGGEFDWASASASWLRGWTCLKKQRNAAVDDAEEASSDSTSSDGESAQQKSGGALVTVDGEKELELETLLKASAYILGASGSSIMYKAVLEDGTTLAVRRIGESGVERFRDFHNQVRVIAKLVHPNLVRIRGFYWGSEEKLIVYEFLPNASLANARYRKAGSSPCPLPWEMRLKIAKGVACGLCYIHEKKHVHGNLKPTNILLGWDMEPKIGDFGLQRLVTCDNSSSKAWAGSSARNFGSKRSTASRDSFPDYASGATPSPSPSIMGVSPYHAPESLRSLKATSKWDVYSFGVVLLELLTGKVIVSEEAGPGLALAGTASSDEDRGKVVRMADAAIRVDMEGKEEELLALLKLGYSCISAAPQKRPSMKEALQALDRFPAASFSSACY
ncbi:probable LRR receptor-like serine/threonine-protein kinase At4g37250 isoform X2 [Salvia hispanica]|uniref:probable LRR receptor-like serine/threonine-protein kinase At4g37250 isoform X2 n=1 Tax=Salvia hispanica TaxID=49212 RepID=UPI002008F1DA|nr:probable LRR receptor-like serine/threonine-protein kinase At4g37250 isoform X2 [Salvia hispanica]